ncbi:MAG: SGNH/GDSL hydrolase family protein [Clostridia bacterium]|nr:SGNH/GDSL hydrolase family protein [Clostridia bacterium]
MKIVLYGDSITDASRRRDTDVYTGALGCGYAFFIGGELAKEAPDRYEVLNRGISGNRIVDLYARVKADVWNLEPDVLSIFIGINDIWHELGGRNGVDLERFERVYRMLIEDTLKRLPDLKIMLCEPYVLHGVATDERWEEFNKIREYAKVVENLAKEYGLYFVPMQAALEDRAERFGAAYYADDGVHPTPAGAKVIADEWLKVFKEQIDKE